MTGRSDTAFKLPNTSCSHGQVSPILTLSKDCGSPSRASALASSPIVQPLSSFIEDKPAAGVANKVSSRVMASGRSSSASSISSPLIPAASPPSSGTSRHRVSSSLAVSMGSSYRAPLHHLIPGMPAPHVYGYGHTHAWGPGRLAPAAGDIQQHGAVGHYSCQ